MIYTPSGVVASVPRIARADFGDPVTFTVQLRPGQSAADLLAAEKRLSRALGVGGLRFVERGDAWVIVEVTGPQGGAGQGFCRTAGRGEGPRSSARNRLRPPASTSTHSAIARRCGAERDAPGPQTSGT